MELQPVQELRRFCETHSPIYIYGANGTQRVLCDSIKDLGITVTAFVVSDRFYKEGSGNDVRRVSEINNKSGHNKNAGILIATLDTYYNEILTELSRNGFGIHNVFLFGLQLKGALLRSNTEENYLDHGETVDSYFTYYEYIHQKCRKEEYNLLCHLHLGDTLMMLGMRDVFEKKYGSPIHYLIPEEQAILPELYGVSNYTPIDFNSFFLKMSAEDHMPYQLVQYKKELCEKIFPSIPQKNNPFVASGISWLNRRRKKTFTESKAYMLGLKMEKIAAPDILMGFSDSFARELQEIASPEQIVLMAPENRTFGQTDKSFWEELVSQKKAEGYHVVSNAVNSCGFIEGANNLRMSLRDLLALGGCCSEVHSVRSGLCDCLAGIGRRLHVYYTEEMDSDIYSLKNCYEGADEVVECILHEF